MNKVKLHNKFEIEIYDKKTGETKYAFAENIVLNKCFWSDVSFPEYVMGSIYVGRGTGTLSKTRASLFTPLTFAGASNVEIVFDSDVLMHRKVKAVFDETKGNGYSWTEVGLASYTFATDYMNTHAMLKDSEGNPITIPKTNTMIVTIYATVYCELVSPPSGHFKMLGGSRSAILRAIAYGYGSSLKPSLTGYNSMYALTTLRCLNGEPSLLGLCYAYTANFGPTINNTTFLHTFPTYRFTVSQANFPIRGVIHATTRQYAKGPYYFVGATTIPCEGLYGGQTYSGVSVGTGDGVQTEFDLPVSLAKPESETIYVGGVAKTRGIDYTIHYGHKSDVQKIIDIVGSDDLYPRQEVNEIVELPQPSGAHFTAGAATITRVEFKNYSSTGSYGYTAYNIEMSEDGVNFDAIGSGSWAGNQVIDITLPTPKKYKYMKVILTSTSYDANRFAYFRVYATQPATKNIVFNTPPASTAPITADFSIDYINKTSNYVLDVQTQVQWGGVQE